MDEPENTTTTSNSNRILILVIQICIYNFCSLLVLGTMILKLWQAEFTA